MSGLALIDRVDYRVPALWRGQGEIAATVDELGVPGSYPLHLCDQRTGKVLVARWAAADGTAKFCNLRTDLTYCVVGHDFGAAPTTGYVADWLTAEVPSD